MKVINVLKHRVSITILLMLLQLAVIFGIVLQFNHLFIFFYLISLFISFLVTLDIITSKSNPVYKIAWLIPVLTLPIFGMLIYVIFGSKRIKDHDAKKMLEIQKRSMKVLNNNVIREIYTLDKYAALQSNYLLKNAYTPAFKNTTTKYYKSGEDIFEPLLESLRNAQKYIFLEYFIIEEGKMWNSILEILIEKVKVGVDVRLIYDDMGCLFTLPNNYNKKLNNLGIKCKVFNPFVPVLSSRFNNRSHRKLAIIDGITSFTGGFNIADEYINEKEKFGYWKDSGIMIKGEASWGMSMMFLVLWNYLEGEEIDFKSFRPHYIKHEEAQGYVQPYSDSPFDDEYVGENVYLNLINKATKYVYITTPYLIIDNELYQALTTAAKSGIDVRIITPHVPDKWYVHSVTKSYYEQLVECGVKIYEYTPGFIHSKLFVVDDVYATVGSINLDYRSLYLHFECGVWLYKTKAALEIKEDFLETVKQSQEITLEMTKDISIIRRVGRSVLRAFGPLM